MCAHTRKGLRGEERGSRKQFKEDNTLITHQMYARRLHCLILFNSQKELLAVLEGTHAHTHTAGVAGVRFTLRMPHLRLCMSIRMQKSPEDSYVWPRLITSDLVFNKADT